MRGVILNKIADFHYSKFEKRLSQHVRGEQITTLCDEILTTIQSPNKKSVRPLSLIALAKVFGIKQMETAIDYACCVEMIHHASILHDDIVDNSEVRRGKKAAHLIWGKKETLLAGDFLFAKSFEILATHAQTHILSAFSTASVNLTKGEFYQLENIPLNEFTMDDYEKIIYHKTASLFELVCTVVGIMSENEEVMTKLPRIGRNIGMCFQVMDDYYDYFGDPEKVFKKIGNDLEEGRVTLPLIHAYQNDAAAGEPFAEKNLPKLLEIMQKTNTKTAVQEYTKLLIGECITIMNTLKPHCDKVYYPMCVKFLEAFDLL